MAANPTRIKGKNQSIKFGTPLAEYKCDLISYNLYKGDPGGGGTTDGTVTFCDADSGAASGEVWLLDVECLQATDADSLWTLIHAAAAKAGGDDIAFEIAPYGNAAASATQPHFTGTFIVAQGAFPPIGGSAGNDSWTWSATYTVKSNTVTTVSA